MTDESKANTVNLQGLAKSAAAERPLLPVALEAIKSQSRSFLLTQFNQVLDLLDDRLFELADKANNAKEQQLYFEAMHEIRVGRQGIVARFDEFFTAGFHCASTGVPLSAVERGQAKLKVLESDALEELVAIEGMSKKTEAKYLKEVWLLCTAWQHCLNGPVMAARDLAVGPAAICRALAAAIEGLSLDIKPKLVLLKLFEQNVLKGYDELVAGLLPVLQAHGLPCDLDNAEKKQAEHTADTVNTSGTTGSTDKPVSGNASELANRLFESLEQLLGSAASSSSAGSDELVLSKPSLMVALQDMQNEQYAQLNVRAVVAERGGQQAESKLIHQLIARLEKVNRVAPADASGLTVQRDRDTIQSVGTLFQYILDGEGLSNELKSVIGRLQIPILKMAMLDKNFFSHDDHPARKLLSSLISASIGWTPNGEVEKDPLFNKVEEIVMRVLRDFGVDTQIFVDACAEFQHFSERDRRRTALLTKRAVDAADGRAMAEQARDYIHEYLQLKLSAGEFPPVVTNILRTAWSKVLFISYVQDGKASQQFADDLKTAERLLWSVGVVADSEHRSELINALPGLVESLRDGFNRASLSAFETSQWFEQLERLHLARLSRPVVNNQDESAQATADLNDLESLDKGLAKGLGEGVGEPSPRPMAKQSYFDAEADAGEVFRPATEPEKPLADVASIEQARGKIAALRVGNWVDYRQNDGKMLRCRLAAVINGLGKYIFVNRSGIKVAELDRDGLVEAIAEQRIFLIEDGRLFDRALESVISNLRDMKDKPLQ